MDKTIERFFVETFNFIMMREENDLKKMGITNLTIAEVHVLEAVEKVEYESEPTMKLVADFLHISKGSLSVSSDRLIKKGFLKKVDSKTDRRKKLLSLTQKGQKVCDIHNTWHLQLTSIATNELDENEVVVLKQALTKIMNAMEGETK